MKNTSTNNVGWTEFAVVTAVIFGLSTAPAYAYVDPGSASLVITSILGAIAAVGYTLRTYVEKVKAFFRRGETKQDADKE